MIWLDDFAPGQKYLSNKLRLDAAAIKAFAAQFDPQPFHLDEAAARESFFGGLAASGWHTAALTMRLLVESGFRPAGGIIGSRADELKWPRPVRATSFTSSRRSSRFAAPPAGPVRASSSAGPPR